MAQMPAPILFAVAPALAGERLDRVLQAMLPQFSRSHLQKLLEQGCVALDGRPAEKNSKPRAGSIVRVTLPEVREIALPAQEIPLDVRYEDGDLLVVNKPRGMVVHPAAGNPDGTLVNALLYHCQGSLSGINGELRPGIVHRIDKDTSGLLLVAKNDFAHTALAAQIKAHSLLREYRAVVIGHLKEQSGSVDAPIGRSTANRKRMCVTPQHSRSAVTHYSVLHSYRGYDFVSLRLETGRTHQIRVHMAHLGHPVAGDAVYGSRKDETGLGGQCLHAALLGFVHPRSGEQITIESELPDYFAQFLSKLKD